MTGRLIGTEDELTRYQDIQRFIDLWKRLHSPNFTKLDPHIVKSLFDAVYKNRSYHNDLHINECLEEFDGVVDLLESPEEFEIAQYSHDIIYNTQKKDNEQQSADFISNLMFESGISEKRIKKTRDLILVTNHLTLPKNSDEEFMVDIDLSILGKPDARYKEYAQGIRKEYSWVSDKDFAQGRRSILNRFLNRPRMYYTEFFRKKYESQARVNLKKEIVELSEKEYC